MGYFLNRVKHITERLPVVRDRLSRKRAAADQYRKVHLFENPHYSDPKRLNRFEMQAYSQSGEDGVIAEIFRRIGTTNRYFVEIGAGDGTECNSLYLLMQNWSGLWIESDGPSCRAIRRQHAKALADKRLVLSHASATSQTVEGLLREAQVPAEPDLLSIDIDGNDYWVWNAISTYRPRVVVVEYNALHRPPVLWVMKENNTHRWRSDTHYGASLQSLEMLGKEKGYTLVGCIFSGGNAFFVRNDLTGDRFAVPFTALHHYEPLRHHLICTASLYPIRLDPYEDR